MTTKAAIIATVAIFIAGLVLSIALIALFLNPSSRAAAERASQLGQGVAMVCTIPLGVIWVMWAARVRKERERRK